MAHTVSAQAPPGDVRLYLPIAASGVDLRLGPVPPTAAPPTAAPPTAAPPTSAPTTQSPPATVPAPTPTAPGPDITTTHYDLHVEGTDVAVVAPMLEDLYADLTTFFGLAPSQRLRGGIYATLDDMIAAMAADGETYPGGGGYYSPASRAFYAFVQPSEYFTRQLILHEATHQFHYLAATNNHGAAGNWYVEGLAEHFGMHNWDGSHVVTGVVPAISLEDYPAVALEHFDAHGDDLSDLIADGPGWDRPDGWGLVSFLIDTRPSTYRELFSRLDGGESPPAAWSAVYGSPTPTIAAEYRSWLLGHQQPWHEVWRAWQERGEFLEGESDVVSLAVLKSTPTHLTAALLPLRGPTAAGLAFGYKSADDFYLLQLRANRDVWILRRLDGGWQILASSHAEPVPGGDVVSLEIQGDEVTPSINGVAMDARTAPGLVGLNVESGAVDFRVTVDP